MLRNLTVLLNENYIGFTISHIFLLRQFIFRLF